MFIRNTFLHVITTCYISGGHTRVVERWINNCPDNEKHSIILLDQQDNDIPEKLIKAVQPKNGCFTSLTDSNYINKALTLRETAQDYEYIILHTHMDDPVPILAFGRNDFTRPVIFFNHADHCFWLGVSIADIVAELRSFGEELSQKRRQIKRNYCLNIPINMPDDIKTDKIEARKKLNFSVDKKIILSMGAADKYLPFGKYNFVKMVLKILNRNENTIFVVIGPDSTDKIWKNAVKNSNGRLIPVGIIPNTDVNTYINAADLYIESFPISSFTALLDVAVTGIPILSLLTEERHVDVIENSTIKCKTINEIIDKSTAILNGESFNSDNLIKEIIENHCYEGWLRRLRILTDKTPKSHKINYFNNGNLTEETIDDYDVFLNNSNKSSKIEERVLNFDDFKNLSNKNRLFVLFILTFYSKVNTKKFYQNMLGLYKRLFMYFLSDLFSVTRVKADKY
jgi:hypothetical protein